MRSPAAWQAACHAIQENDPHVRGIVILGLDAPETELAESFRAAARFDLVKGFAVGRTIFGDAARGWMKGEISDGDAVEMMKQRYGRLCTIWDEARTDSRNAPGKSAGEVA